LGAAVLILGAILAVKIFFFPKIQSCSTCFPIINEEEETSTLSDDTEATEEELPAGVYMTFVVNVHDWVYPEESMATINRVIDLHEQYHIPVDIYLDDPMVQLYVKEAPEVIERLKTSPLVAVSYHLRPPTPYYDYDFIGLDALSQKDLEDLLYQYETSRLDLETGEPTDEPGGYAFLKEVMGYAPYAVGGTSVSQRVSRILAGIYKEMGAEFWVVHNKVSVWKDQYEDLYLRPEDVEVKMYERKTYLSAQTLIEDALEGLPSDRPAFVNLKWHENNFYTSGTTWGAVYSENPEEKTGYYDPPFDLSKAGEGVPKKTQEEQDEQWRRYEEALQYVQDHADTITAVNMRTLAEKIAE